jgi:hypothetical protein
LMSKMNSITLTMLSYLNRPLSPDFWLGITSGLVRNKPPIPKNKKRVRFPCIDMGRSRLCCMDIDSASTVTLTSNDKNKAADIRQHIIILHPDVQLLSFTRFRGQGQKPVRLHQQRSMRHRMGIMPLLHRTRPAPPQRECQL